MRGIKAGKSCFFASTSGNSAEVAWSVSKVSALSRQMVKNDNPDFMVGGLAVTLDTQ